MKRIFPTILFFVCTFAAAQSSDEIETVRDQRDEYAAKLDMLSEAMDGASFKQMLERVSCPRVDTDRLRADIDSAFRTDREWLEMLIKRLAWHLDCRQGEVQDGR